jgi:hypothetical protein
VKVTPRRGFSRWRATKMTVNARKTTAPLLGLNEVPSGLANIATHIGVFLQQPIVCDVDGATATLWLRDNSQVVFTSLYGGGVFAVALLLFNAALNEGRINAAYERVTMRMPVARQQGQLVHDFLAAHVQFR